MNYDENRDFHDIDPCAECLLLGNTLHTTAIFFTINPCPIKNEYGERLPIDQLKYIIRNINITIRNSKALTILGVSVHFEYSKLGQLHAHGIFLVRERKPNRGDLVYLSKIVHQQVGRLYAPASVSCDLQWVDSIDVFRYVNKENAFKPIHKFWGEKPVSLSKFLSTEPSTHSVPESHEVV